MPTYRSEIIEAFNYYSGEASLKEICHHIRQRNLLSAISTNPNWERNVSAELQRHCSSTRSYDGAEDIFYSVAGLGSGLWGYKLHPNYSSNISKSESPIEKRIVEKIKKTGSLNETERQTIINARIGQGLYRVGLINKYHCCIISKIKTPQLLIASHIKPWVKSDNREKISIENGLLLNAFYDRLFDNGLITFNTYGKVFISPRLIDADKEKLGIKAGDIFDIKCSPEMKNYLNYHGDCIFVNNR